MNFQSLIDDGGMISVVRTTVDGKSENVRLWPVDARQQIQEGVARLPSGVVVEQDEVSARLPEYGSETELNKLLKPMNKEQLLQYAGIHGVDVGSQHGLATIRTAIKKHLFHKDATAAAEESPTSPAAVKNVAREVSKKK